MEDDALLAGLKFEHRFVEKLPAACYSRVLPRSVSAPRLLAYSRDVARWVGLDDAACRCERFLQIFSGNDLLCGMDPFAMCYGGHQFGQWAGRLGDGRAINLGEVRTRNGGHATLQLKGAGPTPYSRRGDGLAVLRSSIREFLCSEAMHYLGVPTTRALSLVTSDDVVVRDFFYDGHPQPERGAIICRVAPSFIRFGSFEIFAANGDVATLRSLIDYTICHDFPELGVPSQAIYGRWFQEICGRTAQMIVAWQRVGFVHGVMNTDNMSILGLTLDYGPYGWLENYDPDWTPNTTDANEHRYCFGRQADVALWNLTQLARALYPVIDNFSYLEAGLDYYLTSYTTAWQRAYAEKLGFGAYEAATDASIFEDLWALFARTETDMTIFFRLLSAVDIYAEPCADETLLESLYDAYYHPEEIEGEYREALLIWLRRYAQRARAEGLSGEVRRERMNAVNPKYVLRNYLAQLAITEAENGELGLLTELQEVLQRPYQEQAGKERFAAKRPEWARNRVGCSMLSCSS